MHNSKSRAVVVYALLSLPVMFFFQNCGQPRPGSSSASTATNLDTINLPIVTDSMLVGGSSSSSTSSTNNDIQISEPTLTEADQASSSNAADLSDPKKNKCLGLNISDILLNVESVNLANEKDVPLLAIIDPDPTISMNKLTLKVQALKSVPIHEIFLKLNAEGNKILSEHNEAIDIRAPSGYTAGIKIKLSSDLNVVSGQAYILELTINPVDQLISNQRKCIFKPVIQQAQLTSQ